MLHKPAGLLSATEDRRQKTVLDLLPEHLRRRGLFPVGRLDKDTEGLLLLTDDGPLGHALLSPKTTWTRCTTPRWRVGWTGRTLRPWRRGMVLGTGCTVCPRSWSRWGRLPVSCHPAGGKYHQVKRMLAAREAGGLSEAPVHGAHRPGPGAGAGEWRPLTGEEKALLRRGTAGDPGFSAF